MEGPRVRGQVHFALLALFCSAICTASVHETLTLEDCRLQSESAPGSLAARCGHLARPENPDDPRGKVLPVHVAVVPALRLEPAEDALFVLSGGPGQAASDFYLAYSPAFARIRRDRDIVLVDQRGTGRSNRLDCTLPEEPELTSVGRETLQQLVRKCLEQLPGDPRFYTTSLAVRDLEAVRAALGYERISLYGISYGTRVAQHYIRQYPDRVRAAILDGVVPATLALGPRIAIEAQNALEAAFERCEKNESCARSYPRLPETFRSLMTRVSDEPFRLSIPDPLTGEPTSVTLDRERLSGAVRLLSYSDETASMLPLLIHEAGVSGRPQSLGAQYLMIRREAERQIAQGMHFSVVCSEDAPRWSESGVSESALERTYLGPELMAAMQTVCAQWPRGAVDENFAEPLRSDVPMLLLSGGNDPVTPAAYAQQILPGLSRAKHLILRGQGHGQIAIGCVPRLAAEFISAASSEGLDTSCLESVRPAAFMLSPVASAP